VVLQEGRTRSRPGQTPRDETQDVRFGYEEKGTRPPKTAAPEAGRCGTRRSRLTQPDPPPIPIPIPPYCVSHENVSLNVWPQMLATTVRCFAAKSVTASMAIEQLPGSRPSLAVQVMPPSSVNVNGCDGAPFSAPMLAVNTRFGSPVTVKITSLCGNAQALWVCEPVRSASSDPASSSTMPSSSNAMSSVPPDGHW